MERLGKQHSNQTALPGHVPKTARYHMGPQWQLLIATRPIRPGSQRPFLFVSSSRACTCCLS
eukprot:6529729-Pyramimonas_sp.AAC.1